MICFRKGDTLFEIECAEGIDINYFEEEYNKNKSKIDYLVDNIHDLDKVLDEIGYDNIFNLLIFLNLCQENYIVLSLSHKLETYCHQKEDEKFLEFFSYVQDDDLDSFFENCDDSDICKLRRCFDGDKELRNAFHSVCDMVMKRIY